MTTKKRLLVCILVFSSAIAFADLNNDNNEIHNSSLHIALSIDLKTATITWDTDALSSSWVWITPGPVGGAAGKWAKTTASLTTW